MSRYHVVVDGKTCVFEKENDPRVLRYVTMLYSTNYVTLYTFSATSPGKLLQYLIEDGCHVAAKQPYAEIEVCTMYEIIDINHMMTDVLLYTNDHQWSPIYI